MPKWIEKIVVPVLLVAAGVVGTFLGTNYFKEKRSLGYQILTNSSLIGISPEIKDRIKITYDTRELNNIYSFKVRVLNDGNVPLKDLYIYFKFDKKAEILSSIDTFIPEVREVGSKPRFYQDSTNEVHYLVPLLNPHKLGEEITWNFLTKNNLSSNVKISARGEGLRVHVYDPKKTKKTTERIASISFVISVLLFLVVDEIDRWHAKKKKTSPKIIGQLMLLFTTIIILSGALFLVSLIIF